jgi:outer membrane PBP1 activator LpoA protein
MLLCSTWTFAAPASQASAPAPELQTKPQDSTAQPPQTPQPAQTAQEPASAPVLRIALLLPTRSENLAAAAQALRAGVMAAYERDGDGISIQVIETDDTVAEILAAYQAASGEYDLIIGPLARSAVSALAQGKDISKPTLLLGQPESSSLPDNLLPIGLSIEDQARQLAALAASDKGANKGNAKLMVISTNATWQRRAAKAFASHWPGLDTSLLELSSSGGYLSVASVRQLKLKLQNDKPNVLFIALDAGQARQIRPLLPSDARLYGSSQLNDSKNPGNTAETEPLDAPTLPEGMRLLDLPWLLQPDHSAVMVYPRLLEQKAGADIERLYALGIDAFRIAREIGVNHQSRFKLDGVTGRLTIQFGKGAARFEREESPASVRSGILQLLQKTP